MHPLRFAIFGAGFWARYRLSGWKELEGAQCVGLCDPIRAKAEALARALDVPRVYDDPEELLRREQLDFVDIVAPVGAHSPLVHLAAARGLPVICQKPMAPSLAEAEQMVAACREAGVSFYIHENWRWQTPIRKARQALVEGHIGTPFRARIEMISGFPVFANQPYLKDLEQFLLADMGSHILDVARFLFGEAESLCCQIQRVHPDIQGEDVATVLMKMGGKTTVICTMAYAENALEHDRFPETYLFVEGEKGSLELGPDYWLRMTTEAGTHAKRYPPHHYSWADAAYDIVHSSIVPCNANLLRALRGEGEAETSGEDNLKTVRLIYAGYESARTGEAVRFQGTPNGAG
ncbi:MAG TPA: Gfo/Idh/MocA family oxidoreductase [Chthonomonadaceae bacterium]|nr:Gfo/Idh/MocA family oxidoreductase [Chthonomonadaceae bacterium]